MTHYQITNVSGVDYSSTSLTLDAGDTTIVEADTLPIDLNDAIVAETLIVVKMPTDLSGGGGSGDVETDVSTTTTNASTSSVLISSSFLALLPPGRYIINNTPADVAIRCSASSASWAASDYDTILEPGESCYVVADYIGVINAICELATGTIEVKAFY